MTEHIKYVGLFYWEKQEGLTGGDMKFRPLIHPAKTYIYNTEMTDQSFYYTANAINNKGTAIVFDNTMLVHRVRMLKNLINDKKIRKRGFLAFFIVDPSKKIVSTKDFPSLTRNVHRKNLKSAVKHMVINQSTKQCQNITNFLSVFVFVLEHWISCM